MSTLNYRPGLISETVRLHSEYYSNHWGFGLPFEAKVATELSAFLIGFRPDLDFMESVWDKSKLQATISVQGPIGEDTFAHLRWFIVGESCAGKGIGRRLFESSIEFARKLDVPGIYLTTFAGLDAARHLYESADFKLVAEDEEDQWSGGVKEQRFELLFR